MRLFTPMVDPASIVDRIGYRGDLKPTLETLRRLQDDFLCSVPFENFDIHLGLEISLDPERIWEKIAIRQRGGFCYECNILFREFLVALGYCVDYVSARMVAPDGRVAHEFGHMALIVHLDQDYLADVGNGRSTRAPLPLDGSASSEAEGIAYRVGPHPEKEMALYFRSEGNDWSPRFFFTTTPRRPEEFVGMCRFHQTSPETLFTRHRLATLATIAGRITLLDTRLTLTRINGTVKEDRELSSDRECLRALRNVFGIDIPYYPSAKCPPPPE